MTAIGTTFMKQPKHTVNLPPRDYQPSKAEMSEKIRVNVPGKTNLDKLDNFASAIMRSAKVKYRKKRNSPNR